MTATAWTEERVARLKTLWREGRSAGQIAAELQNGISRSAVLGKVHRLGLSAGRPRKAVPRKAPGTGRPRPGGAAWTGPTLRPAPPAGPRPAFDLPSGGLTILTVRRGQCRWPYGDAESGVTFCGRPVARGAFCAGHAAVGYRTPAGGLVSLLALAGLA